MIDKDQLIADLGIEHLSDVDQQAVYEEFTYELGAAISDGLSDEQMAEFTAIMNGNDDVITAWLASNQPEYRDNPSFQALQADDGGGESVPPEKVFAAIEWIRVNRPDFAQIIERVKREFRAQLDASAGV